MLKMSMIPHPQGASGKLPWEVQAKACSMQMSFSIDPGGDTREKMSPGLSEAGGFTS